MFELLQDLMAPASLIFVVAIMFSTGLSLKVEDLKNTVANWQYFLRLLLVNFLVVPGIMLLFVQIAKLEHPYSTGMIIHACVAGAPLIMALTQLSKNPVALGATVQLVLMAATVVIMPLLLPATLGIAGVSAGALIKPLLLEMILPLAVGMVMFNAAPGLTAKIRPVVGKVANAVMMFFLILSVVAFGPYFADLTLWKAVIVGMLALTVAFYVGYGTGLDGGGSRSQVGALGTAQRNTAAGVITAMAFDEPLVFITFVFINSFMMFVLMGFAKRFGAGKNMPLLSALLDQQPAAR
ncbi:bile acid:sodium symporter [Corynebacterium aquatimens]|uniref:bile acid:sodium symporter family protein n=1 Tax=Corynebacterium TaxID=1716 RepID=UPI001F23C234|nr:MULTISPECIES: bile acid:sodium symporter [Corynebacterium]QYH19805.1 bile acid:sodium symporter [Corynebacterium aquatimens]UIZ93064.1 bile acid:sodium symporter [Corynebacterium sp. CNCTC7651]